MPIDLCRWPSSTRSIGRLLSCFALQAIVLRRLFRSIRIVQHVGIVQAICGTETPIATLQEVVSSAREHVAQLPAIDGCAGVAVDVAAAERRAVVALSLAQLARQQWQQLLAAADGDEMLVHDHVSSLAMACDWQQGRRCCR